ncbi:UDP-N-acetylmuramoyl-L-alanyl-D-glutamate--2,6-diaminopimelate ligase [Schlegelella sp. S2-27]|uniref:UDP-N-acetylmuramoyl-L-alanyl-D-glutamate--2,6-diaminopimelate ligase n=1 Tax=Caldimonas mangrovi TaxID=2944811 RepID=A0ABT0YJ99_9BURK|nr:UDP-N-acetylmuramoyl-L-alanyl-D-glutamate--2,6-diaminopimelate ligase [Caldimonas mangrovi]MCM5678802.1 UDP-N-acetylmuramoyl-L-alanyl-D-glutamate--2,6-diaminopimelate ligase [Caldimonas mangrovi]
MTLRTLASPLAAVEWLRSRVRGELRTDSRLVAPGDAFIAWPGYATDGRRFVGKALEAGATACLVEAEGVRAFALEDLYEEQVAALLDLKPSTGWIADAYYGEPSKSLDVVAVTGTNGKTSTAWWTAQALSLLGRRCGLVGTLGVGEPPSRSSPGSIAATGLTTPDPVTLHATLRRFVDRGFRACALEASSIGIVEHRLDGVRIAVALFTNFTQDHLDYHGDMDGYWSAKAQLFAWPGLRHAVLNLDDPKGAELAAQLKASSVAVTGYAVDADADLRASGIGYRDGGLAFTLHQGAEQTSVRTALIGDYNVHNLLAVLGGLQALGLPLAHAAALCAELTSVPGRMQRVGDAHGPLAVVDYAHTPDALDKALAALQPLARERGGRLWCVFGCGGNRDTTKRPLMGGIAQRGADRVVVTSDNPRHESPESILEHVVAGLHASDAVSVVTDRREAIAAALAQADTRDVVLIAGKGHEDYQEIAGVKHPFSDVAEAEAALQRRAAA